MPGRFASLCLGSSHLPVSVRQLFSELLKKRPLNPSGVRRSPSCRDAGADVKRGLREEQPMRKSAAVVIGSGRRVGIVAATVLSLGVAGLAQAQCPAGGTGT